MTYHPASPQTAAANAAVLDLVNFGDKQDFADATRGFVAAFDGDSIPGDNGGTAWDFSAHGFLDQDCPDTVNPSLWRQAQLTRIAGLFTIHPRIHQIRGFDLANMTLIQGDSGWIVIDPLMSIETARASLAFANRHLGERPVKAVIYTHSHADHFGGVRGVVSGEDVEAGRVPIIAPDGFMDYAISENVLAGNAMSRRAQYQFGPKLPAHPCAHVSCGLGLAVSTGTMSLIPPTDVICDTKETRIIDGVEIEFQMANGSEAPAEFMFYFPQFRALCASEVTSHHMHNVLTPRGAECRNALGWSKYIAETITLFCDRTDVLFACHHWPTWGADAIRGFLERQSDMYRFVHDETLRLANHGHTMHEIAELVKMPARLAQDFSCRGYYGTLKHNVKAVYQFYLGWWDGNPAHYDALPPAESGARLVRAMGGAGKVLAEGRRAAAEGDYRWAAELINKLVFAEPDNTEAQALQADILEQMGYQAEAATWRNIYLTGAQELREGIGNKQSINTNSPDLLANMGVQMLLDLLGVKYNPAKHDGPVTVVLDFTDTRAVFTLSARNGVLTNIAARQAGAADVTLTLTEPAFLRLMGKQAGLDALIAEGCLALDGDAGKLAALFASLEDFDPNFAIVTP